MDFVHLHINTEFSLLKSAAKIEDLVKQAKELQFSALAITDQNVMYGVIPFYKACKQIGIKPIIGIELSVASEEVNESRLILLAKTRKGYQNLLKLSSIAQVVGTNNLKQVEKKHLFSYCTDLVAICSPYKGEVQLLLAGGMEDIAHRKIQEYQNYFGADFYIGIHDHYLASEKQLNLQLVQLSKKGLINLVASNQVMYVHKEDALAHKCLLAIDQGTTLKELSSDFKSDEYYLKSKQEIEQLFLQIPEAIINTKLITEKCNVELSFGEQALPKYPLENGASAKSYLEKLCYEGLKKRYIHINEELEKRLSYELKIIDQMQFNDYFLIVWDFMKFAHEKGMITGPGRGSAAGSIVAFVLNITNVDPIKYDLLFERFLNPERISMPDIDIDFPDTRREEVIDYVYQKYGKNHVAQIITFGTLAAKAALRDIGKVIGIPLKQIDSLAKQISSRPNLTIDDAIKETPFLQHQLDDSDEIKEWFHLAKRVEGIPRHASTHAAGIVISKDPLTDKVPLQKGHYDVLLTQYPMNILEEIGLLKMDFLGLRNLSFLEEIVTHIFQMEEKRIQLDQISFEDEQTFQLLGNGDTTGVFQLESPGMRRVLSKLKPTEFEDIVAVNALYRPGPMENIPIYIAGKHKQRQVTFVHEDLKPILEKTYGVIVYQEQIMQIASKLAGFTLGEADILRRAVSKKKLETLEEQRERFVEGCILNGYEKSVGTAVYDLIVRFANYGFNRSHSVAYSVISYQLAFLKANYPSAFFTALLTSAIGQHERINQYILDAKKKGIAINPPSINKSSAGFTIGGHRQIEFGLAAVKNVGIRGIEEIVMERTTRGLFKDIFDFCARISSKFINRRTLESLVAAGCFDEFGHHRASLLATLDYALEYAEQIKKQAEDGQTMLFPEDIKKPEFVQVPPFKDAEKLYFEKEVLGFYLSSHPIEEFLEIINSHKRLSVAKALLSSEGNVTRVAGLIEAVRIIKTKKGEQMAFIKFSDESGELEVTVFPKQFREAFPLFKVGQLVFLEGKIEVTTDRTQLIVSKVIDVKSMKKHQAKNSILYLKIAHNHTNPTQLTKLKETLKKYPGNIKVILYYEEKKQSVQLSDDFNISASNQCLEVLFEMLGSSNVVLKS
ncbi:DNA polymerase III subunit alpha [Anaerobacillus isosaccharinicus]|uniref:DNA polymerase III subunit alpha n=1 Tax=Anaerobacillus isosaccharinicus TaxID=1532552 RepID=A0A1S2LV61_9BACI|nr:DNA polymerase III subunit alpha [Anaerobacillus isosaccharinicus]MBA5587942.1 DNA polymerase III subunit alpha [Anaerobacillus isosaccharinicus]QOY33908.1 DNA polymerase III subunit alpha [Anaerobacillus isosaccharinicus]